jgi:hypothetical protein
MLGSVGCEARDGARLVVVFKKNSRPAVRGRSNKVLGTSNRTLELWKCPIARRGLELVRALTDIDDVLQIVC